MDSYTDVSAQNCGCSCGCSQHANRPVPANTCAGSRSDAAMQPNYPDMSGFAWTSWDCDTQTPGYAYPETSWTQPGSASCTQTAPGCLEQQYPVAMAYVPGSSGRLPTPLREGCYRAPFPGPGSGV